ncbi:type II toxin-antitoxin system VapC family toxin [Patescibacteria group bacterium]|nr:type II toxin-antitoxin system VapC family toxin [Patescibacteria group bacterium]MBU4480862.1 type II toxin-antitoxin system VapC family toxin [Patescibacteria group bacterium]
MIVLDASVIAKWFIEEENTSSSLYYRDLQAEKKEIIMAPTLLVYELANLFRFKKDFSNAEITLALEALENFGIRIVHLNFKDMGRVANFARDKEITVYDGAYIIVALDFGCKFVTADEKLYKKVKDLGFVKLL